MRRQRKNKISLICLQKSCDQTKHKGKVNKDFVKANC